jgi:hypothetical protein
MWGEAFMRQFLLICVLGIIMVSSAYALSTRVYSYDLDNSAIVTVTLYNNDKHTLKNAQLETYFLGDIDKSDTFRLTHGKSTRKTFEFNTGSYEPGYYPIIVRVTDRDGTVRKKGTWVYIG